MTTRIQILFITILSFGLALAQAPWSTESTVLNPGEVLEVRVDLPPDTRAASFSLGQGVHGQLMSRQPDGSWVGRFAILPRMAGTTLHPRVIARRDDKPEFTRSLPPRQVVQKDGVKQGDGFLTRSDDGLVFVFDDTIRLDTVVVETDRGLLPRPKYENNYFRLPTSVTSDELRRISAVSIHGERLEIITPSPAT